MLPLLVALGHNQISSVTTMLHTKTIQKYDCPTYLIFPKVNEFVTKQFSPRCTYFGSGFWKMFLLQILDFHWKQENLLKMLPVMWFLRRVGWWATAKFTCAWGVPHGPGSHGNLICSVCWDDLCTPEGEEENDGDRNKGTFIHVGKSIHLIKNIFFPEVRNGSCILTLLFLALFTLII